jgi:hypothetical protein
LIDSRFPLKPKTWLIGEITACIQLLLLAPLAKFSAGHNMHSPLNDPYSLLSMTAFLGIAILLAGLGVRSLWHLRLALMAAAALLVIYGVAAGKTLIVIVAAAALVINSFRTLQIQNISRRIRRTRHYGYELAPLLPLMRKETLSEGDNIFTKGDMANRLYVLVSGKVRFEEHGVTIEGNPAGVLFGEFGLFTKSGIRTSSARCLTPVELHSMTSEEVDRLYFQQPEFGYALAKIMATRMASNIENLEGQLHKY